MTTILHGCALQQLATLPDDSVDCVVTSPPYWGLRDYGIPPSKWPQVSYAPMPGLQLNFKNTVRAGESCLGLEPDLNAFIGHIVLIFREIRRVLKPTGTCWVNMGDGYAGSWGSQGREHSGVAATAHWARAVAASARKKSNTGSLSQCPGLKAKDLQGQPWRVAFALQADGWLLRSDIIWHKPNPMPESTADRATKAHEYLFMMTKSKRYFFDTGAWKEKTENDPNAPRNRWDTKDYLIPGQKPQKRISRQKSPGGWDIGPGSHGTIHKVGRCTIKTVECEDASDGFRNKRSVWTIPVSGYKEAHYATFPPDLIRPCIRAGCPVGGVVLDPFGGSGTTAQVALEEARSAILIEAGEHNIKLIQQRLASVTPACPSE